MQLKPNYEKPIDRILVFDWDGVACHNPHGLLSMRYGLTQYLQDNHLPAFSEDFFQLAINLQSGTTEQAFIAKYFELAGIRQRNLIFETGEFDLYRMRYWQQNGVTDEAYLYSDFLSLLKRCQMQDISERINTIYAIGTGNPDLTFGVRLPSWLKDQVHFIRGGVDDSERSLLVANIILDIKHHLMMPYIAQRDEKLINNSLRNREYLLEPWNPPHSLQHTVLYYFDDTKIAITNLRDNPTWVEIPNLRLIHVNRTGQPSIDPELEEKHFLHTATNLTERGLLHFLTPRNHGILEGSTLQQELQIRRGLSHRKES